MPLIGIQKAKQQLPIKPPNQVWIPQIHVTNHGKRNREEQLLNQSVRVFKMLFHRLQQHVQCQFNSPRFFFQQRAKKTSQPTYCVCACVCVHLKTDQFVCFFFLLLLTTQRRGKLSNAANYIIPKPKRAHHA